MGFSEHSAFTVSGLRVQLHLSLLEVLSASVLPFIAVCSCSALGFSTDRRRPWPEPDAGVKTDNLVGNVVAEGTRVTVTGGRVVGVATRFLPLFFVLAVYSGGMSVVFCLQWAMFCVLCGGAIPAYGDWCFDVWLVCWAIAGTMLFWVGGAAGGSAFQ